MYTLKTLKPIIKLMATPFVNLATPHISNPKGYGSSSLTTSQMEFRKHNKQRLRKSRLLSAITIVLVLLTTTGPAFAQFTPPTAPTGITCIGFFCNVAAKVTTNGLFSPMSSVINGLFTLVNFAVGGLYMVRGYRVVRQINRNQEEWKQDAFNIGTSLGVIFIIYLISLGFVS